MNKPVPYDIELIVNLLKLQPLNRNIILEDDRNER
jgi:hypothetical protein